MALETVAQLTVRAEEIRDEVTKFANTKQRVHDLVRNMGDSYIHRNALGYGIYADAAREIEVNAVSIPATTRTQMLNDAASTVTNLARINDAAGLWNPATNKIEPILGSAFTLRLTFCIKTMVAGQGNYIETDLDIGLAAPVYKEITPIIKGANLIHNVGIIVPLFVADPFPANGGSINIFSSVAITLWEVRMLFTMNYKATP